MGNSKQLLLFFLLVMVKWEYVVSGYEVPMGIISSGVLPNDDEEEVVEKREPANVVMNEIPVQEHQEMIPHLNKESLPSNRLLNLFGSSGSPLDIYNSLTRFLYQLNLSPGKTTDVEIIPPEGSKTEFLNILMGNLKTIVPKFVTNAPVSFKLGATRNSDDTLKKITLSIIVGSAVQPTFERYGDDETPAPNTLAPIDVDLTLEPNKQIITLTRVLLDGWRQAKPYIDSGKPSTMVLRINPPLGFRTNDEQNTIRIITGLLNQVVPSNVRTIVQGRSFNYPDGTVKNIIVKILLEPTQQPNGENIEIDLSSPGKDIPKTLRDNLLLILQDERSNRFNLLIIPPEGTSPESSENIANMVNSILLELIPNKKPEVKYRISQSPNGYVDKIYVEIDIERSTTPKKQIDLHFDADLSNPEANLKEQLLRIIPQVKNALSQQPNEQPVRFTLDIVPPKGTNDEYVTETLKTVQETLLDVLPSNKIGVQARITKDSEGNIVNISVISDIEPSKRNPENELTFDLSKPDRNLVDYLIKFTPQLRKILGKEDTNDKPASLTLNIQPPTGVTDQFVRNSMNTVTNFLTKLLPDREISVQAKATKDNDGKIISTTLFITSTTSEPSTTTEQPKNPGEVTVDLSDPTVNLDDVILDILPHLQKPANEDEDITKPRSFSLNLIPPKGSGIKFIQDKMNYIANKLAKYLPNDKLNIKTKVTKDNDDNIVNVTLNITAERKPSKEKPKNSNILNLDLSQPDTDIDEQVIKIIPAIKSVIKNQPDDEPVEFNLDIQPPKGATDNFVKYVSDKVINDLEKVLPDKDITIEPKVVKDVLGNILDINLIINIAPSKNPKVTKNTEGDLVVTLDLKKPESNLESQITSVLPYITETIKTQQESKKPEKFVLKIIPPKKIDSEFITTTTETIRKNLLRIFPNKKVGIKGNVVKDNEGNVKDIEFDVTLEPTSNSVNEATENPFIETVVTSKTPNENQEPITVNLNKPGVNLVQEIMQIIPTLRHKVEEKEIDDQPFIFNMNIVPPKGAKENFVRDTSNYIITALSQFFPKNKIGLKAKTVKDDQGNISDISYVINIEPKQSSKNINSQSTTPSSEKLEEDITPTTTENDNMVVVTDVTTKKPNTITVNFDKPGTDLAKEITKQLPNLENEVEESNESEKPVTFEMNIQPPKGAKDDFVRDTSKNVITTLSSLFPNNKIGVKAKTTKDDEGNIIDISYVINILPTKQTEVTPNELNSRTTTIPSAIVDENTSETTEQEVELTEKTTTPTAFIDLVVTESQQNPKEASTARPEPQKQTVEIDLTNPGSNLPEEIEEVLPKIITPLKKDLKEGKPVTFNFDIEPPAKTTEDFLKTAPKSVLPILTKYFPYDKINVKTTAKKDDKGYLTDIVLSVTVEPLSKQETTTPQESKELTTPKTQEDFENIDLSGQTTSRQEETTTPFNKPQEKTIDVDLTNPGSNLPDEVEEVLPKIITPLKKDLKEGKPVTFNFDIEPPAKTTEDFLKTAPKSLLPVLTKYFPYDKINVKTTAKKDDKGFLTDVVLSVTVEPLSEQETTTPKESEELKTPKPQEDFENIDLSGQTTSRQEETTTPVNKPEEKTIDVDLTNPGSNLPEEVEEVLPKIITPLKKDLKEGKPVTFNFDIEPPAKTTEDFLKTAPKSLLPVLTKYFPYDKINVKTTAKKDDKGYLTDIVLSVTVEPLSEQETTTPQESKELTTPKTQEDFENIDLSGQTTSRQEETTTPFNKPQEKTIDVDLTNPGSNLPDEVEEVLPKIITPLKKDLKEGKPVTFNFDIEPPAKTTEDFLKTAPKSLLPVLTKYFPYDKINVKTTAKKDDKGFLTDVVLSVTVEPLSEQETTTPKESEELTTPKPQEDFENIDLSGQTTSRQEETTTPVNKPEEKTIDVDLTNPGSNLPEEVEEVLPKIITPLKKDLKEGKPVTFNFDIEPPAKTTEDFLKTAPKSLLPVLTKYFPYDKINVKTTAKKDDKGFLTDVVLSVTVEPLSEQETTTPQESEKLTTPKTQEEFENIDLSGQTTSRQEETTTPVNKPQEKTIDVDLTNPGSNLPDEVEEVLPKIITPFKKDLKEGKPVTFNFDIEPPAKTTEDFLKTAPKSLLPLLTKYFPYDKINVKTTAKKDDKGYLTDVVLSVTVEPLIEQETTTPKQSEELTTPKTQEDFENIDLSGQTTSRQEETTTPVNKPQEKTIDVDLTNPGSNLPEEVEEVLPKIITPLKKDLKEGKPVTFNFDIEPPAKTTEDFLKTAPKSLLPVLTKYFPYDKINVKTTAKKDDKGYLTDVVLSVTVEPLSEQETTTPKQSEELTTPKTQEDFENIDLSGQTTSRQEETTTPDNKPQENTIDVDLTNPGSNLPEEVEEVLPKIITPLKKDLKEGKPVTFNFDIEPPAKTTEDFLKTAPKSLLPVLTKYFPYDKINVKTTAKKDNKGYLTDVVLSVTVEPLSEQETTTPKQSEEVTTPKTQEDFENIDLSGQTTSRQEETTTPVNKPQEKTIDVDLTNPGSNLPEEVEEVLPKIITPLKKDLKEGKPVTFNFDIEPPAKTTEDFLKTAPKSLLPVLTKYFPYDKINVKTTAKKDDKGFLTDVVLSVTVEPLSEQETTTPQESEKLTTPKTQEDFENIDLSGQTTSRQEETTTPVNKHQEKTIDVDLTNPGSNLPEEVEEVLPKIITPLKKDLKEGKPVTFNFDIEPPAKTTEDFLKTAPKSLLPVLTKYFPYDKINVKTTAKKDDKGYLTDVVLSVTVEPLSEQETTTPKQSEELTTPKTQEDFENIDLSGQTTSRQEETTTPVNKPQEKTIDVDLTNPGSNLPEEVEEVLPKIITPLKKDLKEGKPVTFNFDIEPPAKTTEDFLKTAPKSLLPVLTKYFPYDKINVKTTAKKDNKGYLTDVVLSVTVEPLSEQETTTTKQSEEVTTPKTQEDFENIDLSGQTTSRQEETTTPVNKPQEKTIDVDLTNPGSNLPEEVEEVLPKIITPLKKDLKEGKPVTFNFDIEPPAKTTEDFLKTAPKSLLPVLTKYFPYDKINVKTTAKKDDKGFLTDVVLSVTVEPLSEQETTTPQESEKLTTPKTQEDFENIDLSGQTTSRQEETTTPVNKHQEKTIDVDLTNPGSNLPEEVEEVLPKIITPLKKDLKEGKPVTFNFDIEPPAKTTEDFLKTAPKSLLPVLTKYFPYDKINVKTTAKKDDKGYLTDVVLSVTVEPLSEQETTTPKQSEELTTPKTQEDFENIDLSGQTTSRQEETTTPVNKPQEKTIDVDLTNPGSNLPEEVEEVLPKIITPLKKDLKEGKPVTFNFDIEPPAKTTEDFLKTAPKSLLPVLTKYFPYDKINVKTTAKKDNKGYLTDVVLSVTVEPLSEQETTTPKQSEEVTTPKTQEDFENIDLSGQTTSRQEETTTPVNKPQEKTIDVDLTNPGSNLPQEVEEVLPKLITPLKKDLKEGKPVTFNFDIEPPAKTTEDFLKTAPKSLLPVLTKYFPYDKINVKTTAKKDGKGYLTDVVLSVTVEPLSEQETTTPQESEKLTTPKTQEDFENIDLSGQTTSRQEETTTPVNKPQGKTIDVDLTNPGSNLPEEVEEVLPKIITPLKKDLKEGKPVTFNFDIEPPAKTTEDFLKTAPKSLLPVLTKYFPYDKINVKTSAKKDDKGYLTDVVLSVTVEPLSEQETTTPKESEELTTPKTQEDFENIDLSEQTTSRQEETTTPSNKPQEETIDVDLTNPGSNLPEEVEEILPNIIKPLKNDLEEGKPVTLNFDIEPPPRSTDDFLKTAPQSLLPVLTKYFPNNRISLKTNAKENSLGFLTEVTLTVNIEPNNEPESTTPVETKKRNIDIDLSQPDSSLPKQVEQIIPKIMEPVEKDLNEGTPVTLDFNIEPPPYSTKDFLQTAPQSLVPVLTKYFPNNRISLKTNAKENSLGFLTEVTLTVNIEPNNELESTTPVETKKRNIDIDLSQPDSSLPKQVEQLIPKIIEPVKKDLNEGTPVSLDFNIDPPPYSTKDFLQTAPQSLVPVLTKYFPNNRISLKTNAKENSLGFLTEVTLTVNIEPNNEPESTTPVETKKRNIDIDLSQPDSSLPEQVEQIIPKIMEPVNKDLNEGTPVTLDFNIEPPPYSTKDFLQTAPQSLVPILSKYFPNNKISLKTKAKQNSQGFLIDVVLSVTIEPNEEPETTTSSEGKEENLTFDLSKPGSSLPDEVEEVLPSIIKPVEHTLKEGKPVTLNFNIQPPPKSKSDFIQTVPQSLVPILSKYFPYNKISLRTNAKENSQGFLTTVVLSVDIEPNNESTETEKPKPKERNVDIDLRPPGTSLPEEMKEIMLFIAKPVTEDLKKKVPVTLKFNIEPPPRSTAQFLQTAPQSIVSILTDYFPNNKMSLKTNAKKNFLGYLSDVVLSITIEPSEEDNTTSEDHEGEANINIDLSKPSSSITETVNNELPTIVPKIRAGLKNLQPMTVKFNIQPPEWATQDNLQSYANSLMPILSSYFPNNQISVKAKAQKNSMGYLTFATLIVNIEPASEPEEENKENDGLRINLDLSNQYNSINSQVKQILPSVVNYVQNQPQNGQSIILYFDIKLPRWASRGYIKSATNYMERILSNSFPQNRLQVQFHNKEGYEGLESVLEMKVILLPEYM